MARVHSETHPSDARARLRSRTPIVLDFGSFEMRAGWAAEEDPTLVFRSLVGVGKARRDADDGAGGGGGSGGGGAGGDWVAVGHWAGSQDDRRIPMRLCHDSNVLLEMQRAERVLDYCFSQLGLESVASSVDVPIVLTECPCNPHSARGRVAELLFEGYGVPSVMYSVDALLSLEYNRDLAARDPVGFARIDASDDPLAVHARVLEALTPFLAGAGE